MININIKMKISPKDNNRNNAYKFIIPWFKIESPRSFTINSISTTKKAIN